MTTVVSPAAPTRPVVLSRESARKRARSRRRRPIEHVGLWHHRTRHDGSATERIFSEEWIRENSTGPGVNFGHGILQDLMAVRIDETRGWLARYRWAFVIGRREAKIVATVIEWLGTNCGHCFLERALNRCGYRLVERTDKWNAGASLRECTSRMSTWPGSCPHCGRTLSYNWTVWPTRYDDAGTLKVYECGRCGGPFTIAEWKREAVPPRWRRWLMDRIPRTPWSSRTPEQRVDEPRVRA